MTVHTVSVKPQLTLDLEPGLVERFPTLLDCMQSVIYGSGRQLKAVAADMDLSASELGRKLKRDPDDPRRFSVDDLEHYVGGTGDTTPIEYLCAKYLQSDEARRAHAVAQASRLLNELAPLLLALKSAA